MTETHVREHHAAGTVHMRAAEGGDSRVIEGRAIVFNTPSVALWNDSDSEAYEQIAPEAITRAVLDASDIFMTLYHDDTRLLARSNKGAEGSTLTYDVDEQGVTFRFTAPPTADGDAAVALVRSGVVDGCSFRFRVRYAAPAVVRTITKLPDGRSRYLFTVKRVDSIEDFTLTPRPAYEATEVSARSYHDPDEGAADEARHAAAVARQVDEMRAAARLS